MHFIIFVRNTYCLIIYGKCQRMLLKYWLTIHLKKVVMGKGKKTINVLVTFFHFP